jgi:hypothetical protein
LSEKRLKNKNWMVVLARSGEAMMINGIDNVESTGFDANARISSRLVAAIEPGSGTRAVSSMLQRFVSITFFQAEKITTLSGLLMVTPFGSWMQLKNARGRHGDEVIVINTSNSWDGVPLNLTAPSNAARSAWPDMTKANHSLPNAASHAPTFLGYSRLGTFLGR